MNSDLGKILPDVVKTVKKAGKAVMSFYDEKYDIRDKGGDSPVTIADIESNRIIVSALEKYDYGLLSEETEDDPARLKKERVWIVDPLDGTKDFIKKTGDFTVMVGLAESGKPVLGVVYKPLDDVLYYAVMGGGAFCVIRGASQGRMRVNKEKKWEKARMLISRSHQSGLDDKLAGHFKITKIMPCGSIGLKAAKIASGEAELNINPSEKPGEYDICAADIILREAGGMLTDMSGKRHKYNKEDPIVKNGYIASNGVLHDEVVGFLKYLNI